MGRSASCFSLTRSNRTCSEASSGPTSSEYLGWLVCGEETGGGGGRGGGGGGGVGAGELESS